MYKLNEIIKKAILIKNKISLFLLDVVNKKKSHQFVMPRSWYKEYSPLTRWLNGNETLSSFVNRSRMVVRDEFGCWLALQKVVEVHESYSLEAQSLGDSWDATEKFVKDALEYVYVVDDEKPEDMYIDHEDRLDILYNVGKPPSPCYPIYIFSIGEEREEKVVYVGLTNSEKSRFSGGHKACTLLLNPKYNGIKKRLYLCHIMLLSRSGDYLPLEWVNPYSVAKQILDDIESQLIYEFKPVFNEKKTASYCARNPREIIIENHTTETSFLNGVTLYPHS